MPNACQKFPTGFEPSFPYPRWSDGWCPAGAPSGKGSGKSPLHDVNVGNDGSRMPRADAGPARSAAKLVLYFELMHETQKWWSQTGSNRRPPACKAGALPTELWPLAMAARTGPVLTAATARDGWWAEEDLNFRPHAYQACALTT